MGSVPSSEQGCQQLARMVAHLLACSQLPPSPPPCTLLLCMPPHRPPPTPRRFGEVFQRDEHGMPRTWQPSVDIAAVTASGRRAAALLLSQLCFVRSGPTGPDTAAAEAAVLRLADDAAAGPGPGSSAGGGGGMLRSRGVAGEASAFDLLSAAEWPGVAEGDVLLAPGQARSIWRQFMSDSTFSVQQVGRPPQGQGHNAPSFQDAAVRNSGLDAVPSP